MSSDARAGGDFLVWRKSAYSGVGNQCVEVASTPYGLLVRDSLRTEGVRLLVTHAAWAALIEKIKGLDFQPNARPRFFPASGHPSITGPASSP